MRRKSAKPLSVAETREAIADYLTWEVVSSHPRQCSRRSIWKDAIEFVLLGRLIVRAAQTAAPAVLYSEDLSNGQRYGTVASRQSSDGASVRIVSRRLAREGRGGFPAAWRQAERLDEHARRANRLGAARRRVAERRRHRDDGNVARARLLLTSAHVADSTSSIRMTAGSVF